MPTVTTLRLTNADRFVLRAAAVSLGLFTLLRLAWIEAHVLLPFTVVQAAVAARWFGDPASPVGATLACSGTDALALCFAGVLAYPSAWRARLGGVAGGAALIVALNTMRIGTLGLVVASPRWFTALHVYVWPALLTFAIAGYVFAWMRYADGVDPQPLRAAVAPPSRRFVLLTIGFLLIFLATSPIYLESARVLSLAALVARGAAAVLRLFGVPAHAEASILWTPSGGFLVTQECIATPLIPVYLAAACAYSSTWRRLIAGIAATLPLFLGLAIARLLLVALPAAVAAPLFWVHAFYQLLSAVVVVSAVAIWQHRRTAGRHALTGVLAGVVCGVATAPLLSPITAAAIGGLADPQGALVLLPPFQIALYVALCAAAWTAAPRVPMAGGLAVLLLTMPASAFVLRALAAYAGVAPHVRDVRAWAIAGPVLIFAAVMNHAPARR